MKNKDKYNLKGISAGLQYMINGCGKHIKETRTVVIYYEDKEIKRIKTEEPMFQVLMDWLEQEDK